MVFGWEQAQTLHIDFVDNVVMRVVYHVREREKISFAVDNEHASFSI